MDLRKSLLWTGIVISLLVPAEAVCKSVTLALALFPTQGCAFSGAANTDPGWKHLKELKVNGVKKFRRGKVVIENYPEEITLSLTYGLLESYSPTAKSAYDCTPTWDPAKVQFSATWRNTTRTVTAKGVQLNAKQHVAEIWCEQMRCRAYWTYEIRLESENIPIRDELVLTIHAEDGKVVSIIAGRLEEVDNSMVPTLPLP